MGTVGLMFDQLSCPGILGAIKGLYAKGVAMPRRARNYLPGLPYHIVQRGNNREVCFIEPENYQFYLGFWQGLSNRYGVNEFRGTVYVFKVGGEVFRAVQ